MWVVVVSSGLGCCLLVGLGLLSSKEVRVVVFFEELVV